MLNVLLGMVIMYFILRPQHFTKTVDFIFNLFPSQEETKEKRAVTPAKK